MFILNPSRFASAGADDDTFRMSINTALGDGLASMTIPAGDLGTYDAEIDWGDGTTSHVTAYNDAGLSHTYASAGTYQISITGTFPHIYFDNGGDKDKVTSIDTWGDVGWRSLERAFYGCGNLSSVAPGVIRGDASLTDCGFAWYNNSLTAWTVALPATLTNCRFAWYGNSLTSWDVALPASVTNCSSAWRNNSLTSWTVELPTSLTNCAFAWRNNSLTSWTVELPTSLTNCRFAWYNNSLTSWDVALPTSLTDCESAWQDNSLTSWTVDLPASLTNCRSPWWNNSLTSWTVDLPASVTDCAYAWGNNPLTSWTGGGSWAGVTDAENCANVANINETDYNALLVLLESTNQNNGVSYHFGASKHSGAGTTARNALVNDHSADITDGGPA